MSLPSPSRTWDVAVALNCESPATEDRIRAAAAAVLQTSRFAEAAISVAVIDDAQMRRLNRQFLEHDYETDVLSFVLSDGDEWLEGEIVVSADTARRCAAEAQWSPESELLLYVVHGALHLIGFQDKSLADAATMTAAEAEVLECLGIERSMHDSRWAGLRSEDASGGEASS